MERGKTATRKAWDKQMHLGPYYLSFSLGLRLRRLPDRSLSRSRPTTSIPVAVSVASLSAPVSASVSAAITGRTSPVDPSPCTWGVERRAEFFALGPRAAVSWAWVPAWGSLEPSRRDAENAQKTRKNGERMGEIWSKRGKINWRCAASDRGRDRGRDTGSVQQLLSYQAVLTTFSLIF